MTVDLDTGALLAHTPPRKDHISFEEAVHEVETGKKKAATKFERAMEERSRQSEILEKKFKKALEKTADDATPPETPFDLD